MIRTNKSRLPVKPLIGKVKDVESEAFSSMVMDPDGRGQYRVGTGGISSNYRLGDSCRALVSTHLQPGVSTVYGGSEPAGGPFGSPAGTAYNQYCCVGNRATVLDGPLAGREGRVTGKISGFGVTLSFDRETTEGLNGTERFCVRACGVGLALEEYPDIAVHNIDPELFESMGITGDGETLSVKVKKIIPGHLVGAGVGGGVTASCGQLMTDFGGENDRLYGLDELCVGDFVAITDMDMTSGRTFWEGAVAVCLVVSGDCESTGAGPGIMTVLACKTGKIIPVIDGAANLAGLLELD